MTGVTAEIIGKDRGFTGVVARLTLEHADSSPALPESIVAKFPLAERGIASSYRHAARTSAGATRAMAARAAREVEFYRAVGADMSQLPRCYAGHADVKAGQVVLLLEDLSAGVPGDALAGGSVAEVGSVLVGVQQIHTRWWGMRRLRQPIGLSTGRRPLAAWYPAIGNRSVWSSMPTLQGFLLTRQLYWSGLEAHSNGSWMTS